MTAFNHAPISVDLHTTQEAPRHNNHNNQILSERWPTLSRALSRYQQSTAEQFSQSAYESVDSGLIRLDERRRLAAEAHLAGIREFDAQLLIACAVRQWALDHRYNPTPSPTAPKLTLEYKSWGKVWQRLALIAALALAFDTVLIYKWFF